MSLTRTDFAFGIAVPLIWGMGFVIAKGAIDHFPPILLMAFRFTLAALVLVWFVKPPVDILGKIWGISIISAALQYSMTFTGLKGLDASVAALVVQLEVPFLVLFGIVFLKERPGIRKWAGIGLAFCGVALISGSPKLDNAWIPLFLVVGGAMSWALGQILVRVLKDIDGLTLVAWVAVFAAPQLFFMSFIFEHDQIAAIYSADLTVWGAVIYLGLIMTATGYYLWYTLVRRHPINVVAPFLLLLPVFAIIGSVLFLGEKLSTQIIAGGIIVLFGVGIIIVERRPENKDQGLSS